MPAKKLYEALYSRTWSRQKRQYSRSWSRPFGARCVAPCVQPGQSHEGSDVRSRRSSSGLTRMRSNRGESNFMTQHYAKFAPYLASLTNPFHHTPATVDRCVVDSAI